MGILNILTSDVGKIITKKIIIVISIIFIALMLARAFSIGDTIHSINTCTTKINEAENNHGDTQKMIEDYCKPIIK